MNDFEIIGNTRDLIRNTQIIYCLVSPETYLKIIGNDFENFDFQRGRQEYKSYKKLKNDIKEGGVIPAITLSIKVEKINDIIGSVDNHDWEKIKSKLMTGEYVDILDGLQRSFIINDLKQEGNVFKKGQRFLLEIWFEKNPDNIMKRMVILNSSQKRMSSKHQIELLFSTFFKKIKADLQLPPHLEIEIVREKDNKKSYKKNEYSLNSIASAYFSFLAMKPTVENDSIITELLNDDYDSDFEETFVGKNYHSFIGNLKLYFEINERLWDIYHGNDEYQKWFLSDVGMSAIFSAIAKTDKNETDNSSNTALVRFSKYIEKHKLDDPLGLEYFSQMQFKKSSNLGALKRRLIEKFYLNLLIEIKLLNIDSITLSDFNINICKIWNEAREAV